MLSPIVDIHTTSDYLRPVSSSSPRACVKKAPLKASMPEARESKSTQTSSTAPSLSAPPCSLSTVEESQRGQFASLTPFELAAYDFTWEF